MLGPKRVEAPKKSSLKKASPKEISLKGSSPKNPPGARQISNPHLQTNGSLRVQNSNLNPLKAKSDDKSDIGSTWEDETLDDKQPSRTGQKTLYHTNSLKIDPKWEWEFGKLKMLGKAKPVAHDELLAGGNPVSWEKYK